LQVGVGGDDQLGHRPVREALHQLADAQVVRADALDGADRAAEHVVAAPELAGLLDRDDVLRLLHDADDVGVAARVAADPALRLFRDVPAGAAEADLVLDLLERLGEALDVRRVGGEEVEGDPLRALGADAGQPAQLVDEVLDHPFVQRTPPFCLPAGSGARSAAAQAGETAGQPSAALAPAAPAEAGDAARAAEPFGERPHLLLLQPLRRASGVADGGEHQVGDGLRRVGGVVGVDGLRVDRQSRDLALPVDRRGDEPPAGGAGHLGLRQLALRAEEPLLHGLRLLEQFLHVQLTTGFHGALPLPAPGRAFSLALRQSPDVRPPRLRVPALRRKYGTALPVPGRVPPRPGIRSGRGRVVDLADDLAAELPLDERHPAHLGLGAVGVGVALRVDLVALVHRDGL